MAMQEMVDAHANRVSLLAATFQNRISREVDGIISDISAYVVKNLKVVDGVVSRFLENAESIIAVEGALNAAIGRSNYYPTIIAFVSDFVKQIDDFSEFYNFMRSSVLRGESLPPFSLSDAGIEILLNQGEAAIVAIESHMLQVNSELRQLLARSLGESKEELIKGLSDNIRKMTRVEPIAKDQLMLFFRTIGSIIYDMIESTGTRLKYSYVGQRKERTRKFCAGLLSGGMYTRDEISKMNNGQIHGVFNNCGGYGCHHWWSIAEVI